jgi:DNA (cytosine-5)-methyltransferase 1
VRPLSLATQDEILNRCSNTGESVTEVLESAGYSFDSLRYLRCERSEPRGAEFVSLSDLPDARRNVPAISFFAGAGGMDLGLSKAGFQTIAAVENEPLFCQTLRKNHPSLTVIGPPTHAGDMHQRDAIIQRLEATGVVPGFDGLFHGGPPCQPFSIAANQRFAKSGPNFKRTGFESPKGSLLSDFIRVAIHFKPLCLVVENVPGLMDIDGGTQLQETYAALESAGYWLAEPLLLNARGYGVPQDRKRLFVVAWRSLGAALPTPAPRPVISVERAFKVPLNHLPDHVTRDHKAESLLRYIELAYGERDKLGRVDRLHPDRPSKTVIAGGLHGGGRSHLHPFIPRTLSPRECARLQTFPDDYEFSGSAARQFTQIGNAVPPLLAFEIGRAIMRGIFR